MGTQFQLTNADRESWKSGLSQRFLYCALLIFYYNSLRRLQVLEVFPLKIDMELNDIEGPFCRKVPTGAGAICCPPPQV